MSCSPVAAEIADRAAAHGRLRLHLHDSAEHGYLTPDAVLEAVASTDPREVSAFLCGPAPMVRTFVRRLRAAGVRNRNIHREHFDWR